MGTYQHAEAFCLMLYRDSAGNEERIWNSRDGVTPYAIRSRAGLEARHVEWKRDECAPDHRPRIGDRIFVDLTIDRAREERRRYLDEWWDDDMAARWPTKEAAVEELAQSDLTYPCPGQPDLIEVTQAWLDADIARRAEAVKP